MNYLHHVFLKNNYLEWMIKEPERKSSTTILNLKTGLEIKKSLLISVLYVPGLNEEFRMIFHYTSVQVIVKGINTLQVHRNAPQEQNSITS